MLAKTTQLTLLALLLWATPLLAQSPYSTLSGTVWKEALPVDNIMSSGEATLAGILVTLKDVSTDEIISAAVSATDGTFQLQNYRGAGSYYIQYSYPSAGFTLTARRSGSDNTINSAADPSTATSDAIDVSPRQCRLVYPFFTDKSLQQGSVMRHFLTF
jgi:hypothetical protein